MTGTQRRDDRQVGFPCPRRRSGGERMAAWPALGLIPSTAGFVQIEHQSGDHHGGRSVYM
ncbi:unnamed protein product [Mycena citricolor]|uniref:Uncharacterized protein n=1 Tax=Mycena citricolor TaxID=2018698 RepID=A0AAD2H2U8_9AGAR|nr:unnamed protein product [Mycena citricolor]